MNVLVDVNIFMDVLQAREEEASAMPYVTSWERIAMEKGVERFGVASLRVAEQIGEIEDQDVLRRVLRLAVHVDSLEEFEVDAGL